MRILGTPEAADTFFPAFLVAAQGCEGSGETLRGTVGLGDTESEGWVQGQRGPAPNSAGPRSLLSSPVCCVTPSSTLSLSGSIWNWTTNLQWTTWVPIQAVPCLSFPLYERHTWSPRLGWWEGHSCSTALGVTPDPGCDQGIPPGLFKSQLRLAEASRDVRPSLTPPPPEGSWGATAAGEGLGPGRLGCPPQPEVAAERRRRECARPSVPSAPPTRGCSCSGDRCTAQSSQLVPELTRPGWGRVAAGSDPSLPLSFDPWDGGPLGDPPLKLQAPPGLLSVMGDRLGWGHARPPASSGKAQNAANK